MPVLIAFIAFALALCACDRHERAAPRADEAEPVQFTVWTGRYEAFVEYPVPVAGKPVRFVTHLTDLKTFEPVREGAVTLVSSSGAERTEPKPARDGIYLPELTFPKNGTWTVRLRMADGHEIPFPDVVVGAANAPEHPDGIAFLKEQQWKLGTRIERVETKSLTASLRAVGVVAALPNGRASVTTPIAGRLAVVKFLPRIGDRVESGQILAAIEPVLSDLAVKVVDAEAEVLRSKLALDQAQTVAERVRKLAAEKAKSERELQEAEVALRTAQARHDAALAVQKAYQKSGAVAGAVELRAPIGGVIAHAHGAVGELIAEGRELFCVIDAGSVLIEARVPEADLARLGPKPDAVYERPGAPGEYLPAGRLLFAGIEVDAETRTVPFTYEVANADGLLRIGMALAVQIEQASVTDGLAIPLSSVVEEDGRPVAYVQLAGETFEKRDLTLGVRDAGWVHVLSGLDPADRVVTRAAYAIRLASVATSIPAHGHSH